MEYRVYQVSEISDKNSQKKFKGRITTLQANSPETGKVMIQVHYSSLNYKDYLSSIGNKGVTRNYPHVPGIDASGIVLESAFPEYKPGDEVVVTGYDLGMNTPGGFGEIITVPGEWIVSRPNGLTLEETMIYGTAGFTAAQCVEAVIDSAEANNINLKKLPIAVTGSGGGVGSVVVMILSHLNYEIVSLTRNPQDDFIQKLPGIPCSLDEWQKGLDERRPLLKSEWSSVIDTVGGKVLSNLIRSCEYRGTVACCGMVAGIELNTTIFPFILRGVRLIGVDSAQCPLHLKKKIWEKLAGPWKPDLEKLKTVISLEELDQTLNLMKDGKIRGRIVLKHEQN